MGSEKPTIVISGVNLTEAGPLAILADCLEYAARELIDGYEVVALVHKASLVRAPGVQLIEYPQAKRSWLRRLHAEYRGFLPLSRRLKPLLWLSLHDMTPNVEAARRAVYCHHASPFYPLGLREALMEPRFALYSLLYGLLYSINLRANRFVIVQQDWMRREFEARFGRSGIVVAHPVVPAAPAEAAVPGTGNARTVFFYPTLPRFFKNIEVIGRAVRRLQAAGVANFEVRLTIRGEENRYARRIAAAFGTLPQIRLIGLQTREVVHALYRETDCLLFPSKLETWGLPISEFRPFGRPMLVADARYAAETLDGYGNAALFAADDDARLADLMRSVIERRFHPEPLAATVPAQPFARNWRELFELLLAA